jgi:thioesterase domain-containing protein
VAAPAALRSRRAILAAVTDLADLCAELQSTWHRDIPLAAAMAIAVESYDGATLTVRAPLAPNRNLHGTAFAGSLFSVCVLTGWGATWLKFREQGLTGLIVVVTSSIDYHKAVTGDLICSVTPAPEEVAGAGARFRAKGRARLRLTCTIATDAGPTVTFNGQYAVLGTGH